MRRKPPALFFLQPKINQSLCSLTFARELILKEESCLGLNPASNQAPTAIPSLPTNRTGERIENVITLVGRVQDSLIGKEKRKTCVCKQNMEFIHPFPWAGMGSAISRKAGSRYMEWWFAKTNTVTLSVHPFFLLSPLHMAWCHFSQCGLAASPPKFPGTPSSCQPGSTNSRKGLGSVKALVSNKKQTPFSINPVFSTNPNSAPFQPLWSKVTLPWHTCTKSSTGNTATKWKSLFREEFKHLVVKQLRIFWDSFL